MDRDVYFIRNFINLSHDPVFMNAPHFVKLNSRRNSFPPRHPPSLQCTCKIWGAEPLDQSLWKTSTLHGDTDCCVTVGVAARGDSCFFRQRRVVFPNNFGVMFQVSSSHLASIVLVVLRYHCHFILIMRSIHDVNEMNAYVSVCLDVTPRESLDALLCNLI